MNTDGLTIPDEREFPSDRLRVRQARLVEQISRTGPSAGSGPDGANRGGRPVRTKRRRRIAVLVLVPAAIIGAAVAYSANVDRSPSQLGDEVTCFGGSALDAPAAGALLSGQDLAAFCDGLWTSGAITAPVPGPAPDHWVACESDASGVDVFPSGGPDLCGRLGLSPLPPGYFDAEQRYAAMERDLSSRFPETECAAQDTAVARARDVLDAHGYTDWRVGADGFSDAAPCGQPDLDPVNGVVTLRGEIRPELAAAVDDGLRQANFCGPAAVLLADVRAALDQAGFGEWSVRLDHELTDQWPCVAGFNPDPQARTITLTGHATGS